MELTKITQIGIALLVVGSLLVFSGINSAANRRTWEGPPYTYEIMSAWEWASVIIGVGLGIVGLSTLIYKALRRGRK